MSSEYYILPVELAVTLGFVLLPAVVCALAVQAYILNKKHILASSPAKASLGLVITALFGTTAAVAMLFLAPASLGSAFGIKEVELFGQHWPIWPAGFVVLGASASLSTWWSLHSARSAA